MIDGEILIWGEFPPNTNTGVSVSNQTVLIFLNLENIFPIVIEEYSWNKKNLTKLFHYLNIYVKLFRIVCKKKIKIFYFTLPLSVYGGLKFLTFLPVVKILSPKTILKAHIHRGDFKFFINKNSLNRFIVRCCFRFIDEIIVLSEPFLRDVLNFSKSMKVSVLHNTSSVEYLQKRSYPEYRREFVCVSNYIKSKGIKELVECFRYEELKDARLSIYGHPYDELYFNKLKLLAPENVSLFGPVGRDDVSQVLDGSDCLIMPSWNEGQPIIVIEAMSLGIPIIATKVGDIPDMLGRRIPIPGAATKYGISVSKYSCI